MNERTAIRRIVRDTDTALRYTNDMGVTTWAVCTPNGFFVTYMTGRDTGKVREYDELLDMVEGYDPSIVSRTEVPVIDEEEIEKIDGTA